VQNERLHMRDFNLSHMPNPPDTNIKAVHVSAHQCTQEPPSQRYI